MVLWLMVFLLLYPQGCSQNFKIEEVLTTKVFEKGKIWARKASPNILTPRNIVWIWEALYNLVLCKNVAKPSNICYCYLSMTRKTRLAMCRMLGSHEELSEPKLVQK